MLTVPLTPPLLLATRLRNRYTLEPAVLENVVLVVYGWKSVEPGTLSWVFPSLSAAASAAHAMTNAVKWAIVTGSDACVDAALDLTRLRAVGGVLLEQAG